MIERPYEEDGPERYFQRRRPDIPKVMVEFPNVIVLIFDTLRPDFLSCYGGNVQTPNMDSIADDGTMFENAYAAGPGTPISHAALFSGRYPTETGVVAGYMDVPKNIPLIAPWLREHGYRTFGMPGPSKMSSDFGYDRGFDEYLETYRHIPRPLSLDFTNTLGAVRDPALRRPLLRHFYRGARYGNDEYTGLKFDVLRRKTKRLDHPFFALVNFTTVHSPYDPPRPYKGQATPELERPRWFLSEILFGKGETLNRDDIRVDRVYEAQTTEGIAKYLADDEWLGEDEWMVLRKWYEASIRYLDDQLGRFLQYFRESRLEENTVLIVTSDHGEYFGEHGLIAHSHFLFDEVLRVPLLLSGPGVPANKRRDDPVSLVDIFETICDLCGLQSPGSSGISLFGDGLRDAVFAEHGNYHETKDGWRKYMSDDQIHEFAAGKKAIKTDRYTYVRRSDGEERLYRRPEETELDEPDSETVRRLRRQVAETLFFEFKDGRHVDRDEGFDRSIEENLRRLGYIE